MKSSSFKRAFLIGGGGHGRVVLDLMLSSKIAVAGVLDPKLAVGHLIFGVPVLGGDEALNDADAGDATLVNGVGANPDVNPRAKLFADWVARGFSFASLRHPTAIVGAECSFGDGSQIHAGAVVQSRTKIGRNSVVNTGASIDHDCRIGDNCFVSPGVVLGGDVIVANASFVGIGAVILPGIRIGTGAIVGAGAIVTSNVADKWIVVGNPATKIGFNR